MFPEHEIVIEREDAENDNDVNKLDEEEEEIKKYETMVQNNEAGTLQNEDIQEELLHIANQKEDETFSKFQLAVDEYPDQIIRY